MYELFTEQSEPDDPWPPAMDHNRGGDVSCRAPLLPGPGNEHCPDSLLISLPCMADKSHLSGSGDFQVRALWPARYRNLMQEGDPGTHRHSVLMGKRSRTLRSGQALAPAYHIPWQDRSTQRGYLRSPDIPEPGTADASGRVNAKVCDITSEE